MRKAGSHQSTSVDTPQDTIISGLAWAAKRTSPATTSLLVSLVREASEEASAAVSPLVVPFSDFGQVSNLRALHVIVPDEPPCAEIQGLVPVGLVDWLLEHAPKLEVLHLQMESQHLPACHITFCHLRHLIMDCHGCESYFSVAEQLPVLETLAITDQNLDEPETVTLEVVDMSGCTRLRQLLVSDFVAEQLIWDATGSGPCPLTVEVLYTEAVFEEGCPDAVRFQAALAQQVVVWYLQRNCGRYVQGMLGMFPQMRVLALKRLPKPMYVDEADSMRDGDLLSWCMPANMQPLLQLETIIITAYSMQGTFPTAVQLPNLRELVIKASGRVELAFRDPVGTISRLDSMHLFGRPFVPPAWDLVKLMSASDDLHMRGLVLASAAKERHGPLRRKTSCIYLRPVGTPKLSIDELCTKAEQLTQCRCGACMCCLRRAAQPAAGCTDYDGGQSRGDVYAQRVTGCAAIKSAPTW